MTGALSDALKHRYGEASLCGDYRVSLYLVAAVLALLAVKPRERVGRGE
ncbi:hypothetical protein H5J25_18315 [Sphingomonas aliaeris]|uniref:Uncharacterized protein n=1 Tax=Sphingomonas aliaeris TaxID=2759526 RepID=A0A974NUP8_9SPHN|nr:hypothetical protein [Sphingomonas aliaeris]QQV77237.1 hypothetical protein H5J25_18315 [Sphingomonas aliaeris]